MKYLLPLVTLFVVLTGCGGFNKVSNSAADGSETVCDFVARVCMVVPNTLRSIGDVDKVEEPNSTEMPE